MHERRNDVGYKTTITVYTSVLCLILGLFVNSTWGAANEGRKMAYENRNLIERMGARYDAIQSDLTEIKSLLRRNIPHLDNQH